MNYKGYHADIKFSPEDNCLVGRVIGTRDIIAFDGLSIDEIEQAFHDAIDGYLEDCASSGIEPNKPYSGKLILRLNPELHRDLAIQAESKQISLNRLISDKLRNPS